jgi:hypothetical protein
MNLSQIRIPLLILFSIIMLWIGFRREDKLLVVKNYVPTFINRYPKESVTNYQNVMKGMSGFKLAPRLQSSILFSLSYLVLATIIVYLLSLSATIAKLTAALYFAYMVFCFALIELGTFGVDNRISIGLPHYLEDLFLSPFFVLALAVLIKAFGFIPNSNSIKSKNN